MYTVCLHWACEDECAFTTNFFVFDYFDSFIIRVVQAENEILKEADIFSLKTLKNPIFSTKTSFLSVFSVFQNFNFQLCAGFHVRGICQLSGRLREFEKMIQKPPPMFKLKNKF